MQNSLIIKRILFCCVILMLANLLSNAEDVVRFTPELQKAALKYSRILPFKNGLAPAKRDGKWGFINTAGKEIAPCKYDEVFNFEEGLAKVKIDNWETGKYGFINTKGEEIVSCNYNYINDFHEGLALVKRNDKYGFINTKGKEVIPCKYSEANDFHEGLALVKRNNQYGFINTKGEEVLPSSKLKYDIIEDFDGGLARVAIGDWETGKYGFINTKGEEVTPCIYDFDLLYHGARGSEDDDTEFKRYFHEGLLRVKRNDKYGFINTSGKEVISCKYDYADDFENGLAQVKRNGKFIYINTKGEELKNAFSTKYDYVGDFHDGLAQVRIGNPDKGKWGFINNTGEEVVPCKYDHAGDFHEGLAQVRIGNPKKGKYGFINTTGEEVVPCKYDNTGDFHEGLAQVRIGDWEKGKWGFINTMGEEVIPCKYYYAGDFYQGMAIVEIHNFYNDKWGIINSKGEEVWPIIYDNILYNDTTIFIDGYIQVFRDGKHGIVNSLGEELMCGLFDFDFKSFYGTWKSDLGDGLTITLIINKDQITEIVKKHNNVVSKDSKNYTIGYDFFDSFFLGNYVYSSYNDYKYYINTDSTKYQIVDNHIYGLDDTEYERVKTTTGKNKKKNKKRR